MKCPSIPLFKWVRFLAASTPEDFKFQSLEMSRKLFILFPKVFERKLGNTAVCNMLCNHRVCQDALGFGEAVLQRTSGCTSICIYIYMLVIWLQNVEYMLYLFVLFICLFTASSHSSNFHPSFQPWPAGKSSVECCSYEAPMFLSPLMFIHLKSPFSSRIIEDLSILFH